MRFFLFVFFCFVSFSSSSIELEVRNMNLSRFADVISKSLDKPVLVDVEKSDDVIISFKASVVDDMFKGFLSDYLLSQDLYFYEREYFYYIDDESFSTIQYKEHMVNVQAIIVETQLTDTKSFDLDFSASGLSLTTSRDQDTGLSVSKVTGGYSLLLDYLKANSNTEILSSPQIKLKHDKTARFQSGQNVPIV